MQKIQDKSKRGGPTKLGSMEIKRRSFQYLKGYAGVIIFLVICVAASTVFSSITPVFYGQLIDRMTMGRQKDFAALLFLYAALLFASSAITALEEYFTEQAGNKIYKEQQRHLFSGMLHASYEEIEKLEIGELMAYLSADVGTVVQYDISLVTSVLFLALNFIIPLCFIFRINGKLSFYALLFIPLTFLIYQVFKSKKKELQKKYQETQDSYSSFTINILQNIPSIKSYQVERHIKRQHTELVNKIYQLEKKRGLLESAVDFLNNMNNLIFQISFLLFSYILIVNGELTLGNMVALGMYINKIFLSVQMMQKIQLDEQNVAVSLNRLDRLKNLPDEEQADLQRERVQANDCEMYTAQEDVKDSSHQKVSVRGLCFGYSGKGRILKHLSMQVSGPGLYSIVGRNGCGKSTLFKILLCFYMPQEGKISVNGHCYGKTPVSFIRSQMTYIQKDPFILRDSLLENIRLYSDVPATEIVKYCEMAGLSEDIARLPDGIYTKITEQGLSSGQRQKLSFARALAHRSSVMLFDEITSDLDGASEKRLKQLLKELSETVIVLSVSHRMQTVVMSDRIFVLEGGRFIAEGNFRELKQECRVFSELF